MEKTIRFKIAFNYSLNNYENELKGLLGKKEILGKINNISELYFLENILVFETSEEYYLEILNDLIKLDPKNSFVAKFSYEEDCGLDGKIIYNFGSKELEVLTFEESEKEISDKQRKELWEKSDNLERLKSFIDVMDVLSKEVMGTTFKKSFSSLLDNLIEDSLDEN